MKIITGEWRKFIHDRNVKKDKLWSVTDKFYYGIKNMSLNLS